MKKNHTAKRRARRSRPSGPRQPWKPLPWKPLPLLLAAALTVLAALAAGYNARRAAPEPVTDPDHLIINEVCADDQTQLTAPDGSRCSWVELYNPTGESVSLDGWSLSNRKTNLYRCTFPQDLAVEGGGRLLVYCTGALSDDTAFQDSGALSAPFRIGRGESVCLSKNGEVVDLVELPERLHRDTSYGRARDGSAELVILTPTPAEPNDGAAQHALVDVPEFSVPSGFYDEAFPLSITAPEGCTVYYTLDSTVPTDQSTPYTQPITVEDATAQPNRYCLEQKHSLYNAAPCYPGQEPIHDSYYAPYLTPTENMDKCTVVRAVAVDAEGNVSDVVTASYFVNFGGRGAYEGIPVVSLVSDPDDLFGDRGILVTGGDYERGLAEGTITTDTYWVNLKPICNFFRKGADWERGVHLDFFNEDQSLAFTQEAGIRNHGNASRRRVPKAFSLYAREKYDGNDRFQVPLFDDQSLTDKVFLTNGAAMRRYLLVNRMDNRTMDTQDYRLVQVFLDGEYWGFYALQEPYNSGTFLYDHYGLSGSDAILLKSNSRELVNVTGTAQDIEEQYNPLMDFVAGHDMTREENWEQLNTMMDVQSFVDLYAANLYLCNMDFNWHQNIYLFKSRKVRSGNPCADGRWHWMLYDVDYSTGDNEDVPVDHNMFQGFFLNHNHGLALDPIFPHLAQNSHFREMFVNTYLDLANDVYGAEEMTALLEQFQEQWREAAYATVLRYPLKSDANTLNPETKASRFQVNCFNLAQFFQERFVNDAPHMAEYFGLTGAQVTVTLQGAEGGAISLNTLTPDLSAGDWQGIYYTDVPVLLRAHPDPGMKLDHWELSSGSLEEREDGSSALSLTGDVTVRAVFTPDDAPEQSDGQEAAS